MTFDFLTEIKTAPQKKKRWDKNKLVIGQRENVQTSLACSSFSKITVGLMATGKVATVLQLLVWQTVTEFFHEDFAGKSGEGPKA